MIHALYIYTNTTASLSCTKSAQEPFLTLGVRHAKNLTITAVLKDGNNPRLLPVCHLDTIHNSATCRNMHGLPPSHDIDMLQNLARVLARVHRAGDRSALDDHQMHDRVHTNSTTAGTAQRKHD